MHIVYKITFNNRLDRGTPPYYYIGSKSNCVYDGGVIYDKNGNPYYGSSTWEGYSDIVGESVDHLSVECLEYCDSYNQCLNVEREYHIKNDVAANPEYFNKTIAMVNTYSDPDYATYKNINTGKVVRLPRDHPMVENGEYVGVTKGVILSDEHKSKIGMAGEENPFYGRKHNDHTIQRLSKANLGKTHTSEVRRRMSEKRKGVPKSEDHKSKIGRKGLVMMKNVESGKCLRVARDDAEQLDKSVWKPLASLTKKRATCPHCGMASTPGMISRWHNENCKYKESDENQTNQESR